MGWWVMSESNLDNLLIRYYIHAYGQSQDRQLQWWNSLTDTEREMLVQHVSEQLSKLFPIIEVLSEIYMNAGNVIIDWYNNLDPEVKQVMQAIVDGKGIDALRK